MEACTMIKPRTRSLTTWFCVAALLALPLGLQGGCGKAPSGAEAAQAPPRSPVSITVTNGSQLPLENVGMESGGYLLSYGGLSPGQSKLLRLPPGVRPSGLSLTWRDNRGQRYHQDLRLASASMTAAAVTIDRRQQATVSVR
jgi:hypothetical protein